MPDYWGKVGLLNLLVECLLLMGTNRLCGYPSSFLRIHLGAALGSIYAVGCLLPGFRFLGGVHWRIISLAAISMTAFGLHRSALRRGAVFTLLHMALGGLTQGIGDGGIASLVIGAGGIFALCLLGFRGSIGGKQLIPVELNYKGKQLRLMALRDTGNTLRDPLTGSSVLVVGAEAAMELTGLTIQQLKSPLEAIGAIPGLRLIPYRSVGQEAGFLLAMRIRQVKVGSWKGSALVAFAPEGLGTEYQALTGGVV